MFHTFSSIRFKTLLLVVLVILGSDTLFAQTAGGYGWVGTSLIIAAAVLLLSVIGILTNNFISNEEERFGQRTNTPLLPGFIQGLFQRPMPEYAKGKPSFSFSKGHDIKLKGSATKQLSAPDITRYALQPPNYRGIAPIPKLLVGVGDEVKAGDQVFFDKGNPDIKYVAPVSGEVIEVNRGAKRAITEIVILADKEQQYRELPSIDLSNCTREELVSYLLDTGLWPSIVQRPYDIVADPSAVPSNIFISTFDTAPLAPDNEFVIQGHEAAFQLGLNALSKLTDGKVYLGLNANAKSGSSFEAFDNAECVYFRGAHPSGNVGVQMHHIAPISNNKIAWTAGVQEVINIGYTIHSNAYNADRIIAIAGQMLNAPHYVKTKLGANISELLDTEEITDQRIIAGDPLSGIQKDKNGYVDAHADQLTIIEEGDKYELFGWLLPSLKPSISRTYPNFLFKDMEFKGETNTHGEERAFVVSGQYEQMLPMDIYPQHLMKAILTKDLEKMEGLGIYELSEEDVALCEFACTSKQPLQKILREGLEMMRAQG